MRDYKRHPVGVHPNSHKNTAGFELRTLNEIPLVRIPMSMQIGPPCKVCVSVGDKVQVGQMIGEPIAAMGVPIHSSVSGEVSAVTKEMQSNGRECDVVEIKNDKKFKPWEGLSVPEVHSREDFVAAVRASGLVGLGGAGFPVHFKLAPPPDKKIDHLLVNGMECEPYITSDDWLMCAHASEILEGIHHVMKWCEIPHCIIGVEDNKPLAIQTLKEAIKDNPAEEGKTIELEAMKTMYPQGAEKVLIRSLTGRQVPSGGLPHDVGCLVMNVSTIRTVATYLKDGMPLTRRNLTMTGPALNRQGLYSVPIGALISDLIEISGGFDKVPGKIIMGGPMMGVAVKNVDSPIIKMNNAILVFDTESAELPEEGPCIHCGRCSRVCPMELMPTKLDRYSRENNVEALRNYEIMDCIECGSCTFICPAKRYLVQNIRIGKNLLRADDAIKKAAAKAAAEAKAQAEAAANAPAAAAVSAAKEAKA